uniref:Uncharacterized protein n=1 Tax=Arundo donax TaxID=35708 RepID=A0A0A8Z578_ARUDO
MRVLEKRRHAKLILPQMKTQIFAERL